MTRTYHRRLWAASIVFVAGLSMTLSSCGGAQMSSCNRNDMSNAGQQACFSSGNPAHAAVAVGVAAVAWGVVGCTANGCTPPYRCNTESKLCEAIVCDEGNDCPPGYDCDLVAHKCE